METQNFDLDNPRESQQDYTKFQDAILFFLLLLVVLLGGVVAWLFMPKVEYFEVDPASDTVYRQWTYGTVEKVTSEKIIIMGE